MTIKNNKKTKKAFQFAYDCFPRGKLSQRILHERAEMIAKKSIDLVQKNESETYISFHLGNTEKYGIPYLFAKEVINNFTLTPVPCTPKYIAGVINRRGTLMTVIDLKNFFFNQETHYNADACIIVVSANNMTVGILADHIEGNANYNPKTLDPPLYSENTKKAEYIIGLHQGKIALINVEIILADPKLHLKAEQY